MDAVTYILCKKLISKAATGIKKIEVNEQGDLVFTMADGSTILVDMPIKMDCVDFVYVDSLPISGMETNRVYVQKTSLKDEEGNTIYRQYMWVDNAWKFIGVSGSPVASIENIGLVKPDGKSITIDDNGSISVDTEFVYNKIENIIQTNEGIVSDEEIDDLFNF